MMPKDRVNLSDLKPMFASGELTPERAVEMFDVIDDGEPTTQPIGQPAQKPTPAQSFPPKPRSFFQRADDVVTGFVKGGLDTIKTTVQGVTDMGNPLGGTMVAARMAMGPDSIDRALEPANKDEATGKTVERVAEVALPLVGLAKSAMTAGANFLRKSAVNNIRKVFNPTTKVNKALTEKVAPEIVDRGLTAWTREGFTEQIKGRADEASDELSQLWDNIPDDATINVKQINRAIGKAKGQVIYQGPKKPVTTTEAVLDASGQPALDTAGQPITQQVTKSVRATGVKSPAAKPFANSLDSLKKVLVDMADEEGNINVHRLKNVRQLWDTVAANAGGYAGQSMSAVEKSQAAAHRHAANYIRRELANEFPDIAKINKEYTFWRRAHKVMTDTLTRKVGQATPMGEQIITAGGVAGGLARGNIVGAVMSGGIASLFRKVTTSTAWNTVSAQTKTKLANALGGGNFTEVDAILTSILAGRAVEGTVEPNQ